MDVSLVRWPEEQLRRAHLRAAGEPVLLLVESDAPPPEVDDWLEDWVRLPAVDEDVRARVRTLSERARQRRGVTLDPQGRLHRGERWVALSPLEMRIVEPMVERFGRVTSRETVIQRAWPEGLPNRNALDAHLLRLRRRVEAIGLEIRTVRSRGYALQARVHAPSVGDRGDVGPHQLADLSAGLSGSSQRTAANG
jgi:DNA-binding winged helix-turn-helix (wHTH) protein